MQRATDLAFGATFDDGRGFERERRDLFGKRILQQVDAVENGVRALAPPRLLGTNARLLAQEKLVQPFGGVNRGLFVAYVV
jgi:hypothetical protein